MDYFGTKDDFERALAERLKPIMDELTAVKSNRDQILNEKRSLEGKATGRTQDGVIRTTDALHIPRQLVAGNAAAYQRYRQIAQNDGLSLKIIDRQPVRDDRKMPDTYTSDRVHFVSKEYIGSDGAKYRAEKAHAEKLGLKIHVVSHASELPVAAFLEVKDE